MLAVANLVQASTPGVVVERQDPQHASKMHRHDNLELVVVTGGTGLHHSCEGSWRVQRGDVFVIPVGMAHRYGVCDELHLINIGYDPQRLALPLRRLAGLPGLQVLVNLEPRLRGGQDFAGHLHLDDGQLAGVLELIVRMEAELAARAPAWEESAASWLLQILIRIGRSYAGIDTAAARRMLRLGAVLEHLDRHLADELRLEQLCRIAGMSRATLERQFRAAFGTSVIGQVIARRLQAAQELLLSGDLTVAEIAGRVGFRDPNYFTRCFTRSHGLTPTAYRLSGSEPRLRR